MEKIIEALFESNSKPFLNYYCDLLSLVSDLDSTFIEFICEIYPFDKRIEFGCQFRNENIVYKYEPTKPFGIFEIVNRKSSEKQQFQIPFECIGNVLLAFVKDFRRRKEFVKNFDESEFNEVLEIAKSVIKNNDPNKRYSEIYLNLNGQLIML